MGETRRARLSSSIEIASPEETFERGLGSEFIHIPLRRLNETVLYYLLLRYRRATPHFGGETMGAV